MEISYYIYGSAYRWNSYYLNGKDRNMIAKYISIEDIFLTIKYSLEGHIYLTIPVVDICIYIYYSYILEYFLDSTRNHLGK